MPIYFLTIPFYRKLCYNHTMDNLSDGTKRLIISMRLVFVAIIIFIFAGATAIKKPSSGIIGSGDFLNTSLIKELGAKHTSENESVAKDNNPEVPVTSTPKNDTEEKPKQTQKESSSVSEKSETSATNNPHNYAAATATAQNNTTSNSSVSNSQNTRPTAPNYDSSEYDAGSPYEQVYVDDNNPAADPIPSQSETETPSQEQPSEQTTDNDNHTSE